MENSPATPHAAEAETTNFNHPVDRFKVSLLVRAAVRAAHGLCLESTVFMAIALAFACFGFFKLPPFITFDGPSHYYRALQVAKGVVRPTVYSKTAVGGELSQRYKSYVESLWPLYWSRNSLGNFATWGRLAAKPISNDQTIRVEFTNTAVYSPLNYIGSGVGIATVSLFSGSPFVAERGAMMANLALYCLIMVLAIETLPVFRRGALLAGSSPVMMFQAMSVSSDGLNFALPLMFFAAVLRLRLSGCAPTRAMNMAAFVIGALMALVKPTSIVLVGFLVLIPADQLGGGFQKALVLIGTFLLSVLLWWWWNRPYLNIEIARWFFPDHYPASKMKAWFLQRPLRFAGPLWRALAREAWEAWPSGYSYIGGWVPNESYQRQMLPLKLFQGCLFLCGGWIGRTDKVLVGATLTIAACSFTAIALTLWLSYGDMSIDHIPYLAGRYLLFIYFLMAFALSALTHNYWPDIRRKLVWPGLGVNIAWMAYVFASVKY